MKIRVPHIVQYQGSKRKLAPQILPFFPTRFNRLIEPFSGMAAITLAVASEQRTDQYIINDLNKPLLRLLEASVNNPNQLINDYTDIWNGQFTYEAGSEAHYYHIRERFNNGEDGPAMMLYILARCVKGAVRYGANGNFNQSPDKRRNGTNPDTIRKNIISISHLLKNRSEFFSCDYREILEMAKAGDIIYMDPPYQGVCTRRDSRYFSGISFDDFVDAIDRLNSRGIDFIISYDGSCGDKEYGDELPKYLELKQIYLDAGLSTQSLFNGEKRMTKESLYISRNLIGLGSDCPH